MSRPARLFFFCGKMAAGKSTLARTLAEREGALLFVQDDLLARLFPGEITDIAGFVKYSARLRDALAPHICDLLSRGVPVVLDFPANTRAQRAWFRELFERAAVGHELHFIDVTDATCKARLRRRSAGLPPGSPWTTDAEFDALASRFEAPTDEEGFNVIRHARP